MDNIRILDVMFITGFITTMGITLMAIFIATVIGSANYMRESHFDNKLVIERLDKLNQNFTRKAFKELSDTRFQKPSEDQSFKFES
tara:strand:+ start:2213 stop:2470 length:258 start_codon:yes stop_codon:yes gene_type:complete